MVVATRLVIGLRQRHNRELNGVEKFVTTAAGGDRLVRCGYGGSMALGRVWHHGI